MANLSFRKRNDMTPILLWTCVARDDTILVEAGEDTSDGSVSATAKELLKRDPTPGWEFHTQSWRSNIISVTTREDEVVGGSSRKKAPWSRSQQKPRLKGVKFHVYERDCNNDYIVWVFAAVYDTNNSISKEVVQAFITKLVVDTESCRQGEFDWLYGPTLACQESFAPVLRHYMLQIPSLARKMAIENHVEEARRQMEKNIELLLERGDKIVDLQNEATKLQEMAAVFKKNAKNVQRLKMWSDAKHGLIMGTAIAAGVAAVAVPPIVAILL